MRIRSTMRRTVALVAVGGMLLGACASDDEPADEPAAEEDAGDAEEDAGDDTADTEDDGGDMEGMDVAFAEGVTEEACPDAVNADNGCIYLGIISDLTQGPFAAAGPAIVDAQRAFWRRVNEQGGIGGEFDVDVDSYIRDNLYNPETHNAVYQEIKPEILALAQSLGSPTTAAIEADADASNILISPASWTSLNEFSDIILESGNNYCVEAANALDYYAQERGAPATVMAVHLPGDYGGDAAAGAKKWADANGATFSDVLVAGETDSAIAAITNEQPDIVVIATGPTDTATVIGNAVARGYAGFFIGSSPTWNPALLGSPSAEALLNFYWQAAPWAPLDTDTPGHAALRDQLNAMADELESYSPDGPVSDFFTAGWAWSYPLLAALEAGYESGDLTRAGVRGAVATLDAVDYEGMLPAEAGDFTGDAANQSFNQTVIAAPSTDALTGVTLAQDFFEGPTVGGFPFNDPCYVEEGLG